MKKINLFLAFIFILIFQVKGFAQVDFYEEYDLDPGAVEIVEQRTEVSKTFLNPDSSKVAIIFNTPIHEIDESGDLIDCIECDVSTSPFALKKVLNSGQYVNNGTLIHLGRELFGSHTYIHRSYLRWNLKGIIPANATVDSAKFELNRASFPIFENTEVTYGLYKLDTDPGDSLPTSQSKAEEIFNDCADELYEVIENPEPARTAVFNNEDFTDDLISHLADGWIALGMKNENEVDSSHYVWWIHTSGLKVYYQDNGLLEFDAPDTMTFETGQIQTSMLTVDSKNGTINFNISETENWIDVFPFNHSCYDDCETPRSYTVRVAANNTGVERIGYINLDALTSGVDSVRIVVKQSPRVTLLTVTPTSINADSTGNVYEINVSNEPSSVAVEYDIDVVESPSGTWISAPESGETIGGESSFNVDIDGNYDGVVRRAKIYIIPTNPTNLSITEINIKQGLASNLTLPDDEIPGQQSYIVTDWIVANSFIVGTGGDIDSLTLGAGNKITLNPGFTAKSDAGNFRAYIHDFSNETDVLAVVENNELKKSKTLSLKKKGESIEGDITNESIPTEFSLSQNYPNPFNPTTNIKFALPERSYVNLTVYNLVGQKVAELTNNELKAGYHTIQFNGSMLSSGLYFYRITTNKFTKTYKMLLVK